MSEDHLLYEERDGVATITLNRPKSLNALSRALSDDLVATIERIRLSDDIKTVVIRGAGDHFCVGDDIKEFPDFGNANQAMKRARYYQNMANQLEELDKVTIAAVDGYAVGGGLEITMACDFVVATERSRWGMPEVDVGITPGWGGTTRMTRLIGRRMTKEINLLGAIHPAKRAVSLGLWNRVVPDGKLDEAVDQLLALLATKHQQGLRQLKFIINKGAEADLYTAQGFEAIAVGLTWSVNGWWEIPDADKGAGIQGFIEKNELWRTRRDPAINFWVDEE